MAEGWRDVTPAIGPMELDAMRRQFIGLEA
jgi:hypothetical protein